MVRRRRRTGILVGFCAVLVTLCACVPAGADAAGATHLEPVPDAATSADGLGSLGGADALGGHGAAAPGGGAARSTTTVGYRSAYADIPLYADGAVVGIDGMPRSVAVGEQPTLTAANLRQDLWVARGTLPGPESYADLARQSLRDLDTLVLPGGAAVAGLTDNWRYVWPRDASFVAAALARTGHVDDAYQVLEQLQTLLLEGSVDGLFHARYLPDGSGDAPDDRGTQLDGSGWVLWAVAAWYAEAASTDAGADAQAGAGPGTGADPAADPAADADPAAALVALRPLITRSVEAIRANVGPDGMPTVSPDYWEVSETAPTLGTAAALLLGLRAVGQVLAALGEPPVDDVAASLEGAVTEQFAPTYGRHPGDWARDTAVAFLMPPFAPADDDVTAAWASAARAMARPAGGLAPGVAWRQDGVSWTPTTAMFALTAAASGDRATAREWLDWLDGHRTARGSLPEKVLWDGSASAVAPLAWTCALVLLALDELDEALLTPAGMAAV